MKALVLAGGLPQIELIKQLKERNITTVLADGNANALARPYADIFYQIPIFDVEEVKNVAVKEQVDFLITVCADQVLLIVAQVSEMLGLPCYIDYQTAVNVSDKKYMKRIFAENDIPTSRHVEMSTLDWDRIKHLEYPLVVKPVDAYSSRGVRKAFTPEELELYFKEASEISRCGDVIVEEFCSGEEISVDVYVEGGKAKLLCISNSEKIKDNDRFIIFRGRYPAATTPEIVEQIEEVAQKIADAFGLVDSPMLIQMINNGKRVSVLEFCARTGGNMKYLLIKRSCGFDVVKAVIDLTVGEKPVVELKEPQNKYIVNDFIYCTPGTFDRLEGFDEMLEQGIITDYYALRPQGMNVRGVASSSDRIAGITVQADTLEEFNRKHRIAVESVKVLDTNGNDIMRHDLLPDLL
ncbi:MAG: ATP-grasp domain-containing protein [Clostridia bacterium]|nr:ATP-grasp domain-containing protein [Clostridia bacterium]MBR6755062.1 ATP-grasp domain-containing protein [Clostridia bacterium]